MSQSNRREFLRLAAAGSLAGFGDLTFLSRLRPLRAEDTKLNPNLVRLDSGIEPLVRLIEETPRARLIEEIGQQVRDGLSYQELLAALMLAGVRNIRPRPHVGFKFHAVLVVNSAHLASMESPDDQRWLPIFWALDNFKSGQARNLEEGGWRMGPADESRLPQPGKALTAFDHAMNAWDEAAADAAAARLARSVGMNATFDRFAYFGCRDFRDIGHKIIFVANAFRTLQVIGWHHAEPILRSLAFALLKHDGTNPAQGDLPPDRPGRKNLERLASIRPEWLDGRPDAQATLAVLETVRTGSESDAAAVVVDLLNKGVGPASIWDGLLLAAGELLMRQPGIVGLHTLTTANAMHYCFQTCGEDSTRRLLLLQCASFLPLFREAMHSRGEVGEARIDRLEPAGIPQQPPSPEWVFADVGRDRPAGAAKALAYLRATGNPRGLLDTARLLVFLKGNDSHDYKFSSAVLEDFRHVSPAYRERFLAASTYWLRGSSAPDNALVQRIRHALRG